MAKIVIISGIQVIDNPRVVKEADALSEAGHDVEVLGAIHDAASGQRVHELLVSRRWRHTPVLDLASPSVADRLIGLSSRLRCRVARTFKSAFNLDAADQLGPATRRLYKIARGRAADLYITHLPQALWSGVKLLEQGRRVAIDVEDWYSENGLPEDRARQPIGLLRAYERVLLARAAYVTTTSAAMAAALAERYSVSEPHIVFNSFPVEERASIDGLQLDRNDRHIPSIIWFSQTIGPGRGLETLVAALNLIEESFELHLRGTSRPGYREALLEQACVPLKSRIHFHPRVPQDELLSRLAEHDIGYCGEISDCENHDLTIANKVFEYMRARLAVVASDTSGQMEIAHRAKSAVRIFRQGDVGDLSNRLRELIRNRSALEASKVASLEALRTDFNWADQKSKIQRLAGEALGLGSGANRVGREFVRQGRVNSRG